MVDNSMSASDFVKHNKLEVFSITRRSEIFSHDLVEKLIPLPLAT